MKRREIATQGAPEAIGPYSQNSSNILAFILAKKGKDFSITNALLQRSFALLRRFLVKPRESGPPSP